MWKVIATLLTTACLLGGCVAKEWRKTEQPYPARDELIGVYYWGDGMGANEVMELRSDGTYKQFLPAHLTPNTATFYGQWKVRDKHIYFYTSNGTYPANVDQLTYAETFYYKDKPAFVRIQDLDRGNVHYWWVYRRHSGPDA